MIKVKQFQLLVIILIVLVLASVLLYIFKPIPIEKKDITSSSTSTGIFFENTLNEDKVIVREELVPLEIQEKYEKAELNRKIIQVVITQKKPAQLMYSQRRDNQVQYGTSVEETDFGYDMFLYINPDSVDVPLVRAINETYLVGLSSVSTYELARESKIEYSSIIISTLDGVSSLSDDELPIQLK